MATQGNNRENHTLKKKAHGPGPREGGWGEASAQGQGPASGPGPFIRG